MKKRPTLLRNIILYRKFLGITQESLAHKAGLDPSYVSKIERMVINPTLATYEKLCKALNTNVAYLSIEGISKFFESSAVIEFSNGKYKIQEQ